MADNRDTESWAAKMRKRRFAFFLHLLQDVERPVHILDVGGEQRFWEVMSFTDVPGVHITLLNVNKPEVRHANFSELQGDATHLIGIDDRQFDVVFSNSVLEHVGGYNQQKRMAQEVRRVGKRYFVQTPNYWFPIEPHFLFPGFQYLPVSIRAFLINHFDLGWMKRIPEIQQARAQVEEIRLLREKELLELFPDSELYREKVLGLTKSFVVYHGW
jgi:2-polyprenyl-3-methyl-5-hydroxy-6-metoxy-1,4-benzoquinol methylase